MILKKINRLHFLNCDKIIYFNHEINEEDIKNYHNSSKKYQKANLLISKEYKKINSDGRVEPLTSVYKVSSTSCKTNLKLSFIKLSAEAEKFKFDNRLIYTRDDFEKLKYYDENTNEIIIQNNLKKMGIII